MKELEFYKRAAADAAFRRAQLEDLRYYRQVGAGLIGICGVLGIAFSIYGGVTEAKWDQGFGLFMAAALCAATHSTCVTRAAALEVFEEQTPNPSLPASGPRSAAAQR